MLLKRFRGILTKLSQKGMFYILIGNTIVKILGFGSAILVVRILTKTEYGLLAYVDNIMSYLLLFNGLGISNAILRYCSIEDDEARKVGYLRFGFIFGNLVNVVMMVLVLAVIRLVPMTFENAIPLLTALAIIPFLAFAFDVIMLYMRAELQNKRFAFLSVIYSLILIICLPALTYFINITGVVIARYISYLIVVIAGTVMLLKKINRNTVQIEGKIRKEFIFYGFASMAASGLSMIMPLNEMFVVGYILKNEVLTANYRVASLLPQNIQFITVSVMMFVFPYFARHQYDGQWILRQYMRLTAVLAILFGGGAVLAIIISPQLMSIFFGTQYFDAIPLMRVMWVTFCFNAAFRIVAGNVLAAIGDVKFNMYTAAITSVLHIGLDIFFVSNFGIIGAAIGLCIAYIFSGVASMAYLIWKCKKMQTANIRRIY